jgi:hypothetical protein
LREAPFEGLLFIGKLLSRAFGFSSPVISAEFAFKNAITFADFDDGYLFID